MHTARSVSGWLAAVAAIAALVAFAPSASAQTTKEEADLLAAPAADLITAEFLAPAVRRTVANGIASVVARMTAEGNEHGLVFPPAQTMTVVEVVDVPAKRVQIEYPVYEHEYATVEKIVPVMQSGNPTGRFTTQKVQVIVKSRQVGTKTGEHLVPDKDGTETMKRPKYGPGGPAAWGANVAGLNGMALYVLVKAGLAKHLATVRHADVLAEHVSAHIGLPDATFDVAWLAAGFAALGPESRHADVARRLVGKLIDGQVREKGPLDGLWGPVCVNYGHFGKLMTLGQTVMQELDVHLPKKLETATPADQPKLVALGREMKAFSNAYAMTHRDVFRAGTRMLEIESPYAFENLVILPGLPYNAYQWVVTDVESTEAASFALAVAKQHGLLPKETERLAIRGKKIHPPVKADAVIKLAARRMAAAIDADGGSTALALVAKNTGYDKTGFPAPAFSRPGAMPPLFDLQTACTTVAAQETLESLAAADATLAESLAEPRQRSHDRAARIAARWYAESAAPSAPAWKSMYAALKVSHAELAKSGTLTVPAPTDTAVAALPWGPAGSLYRIVPGFRGLFSGAPADQRFADDLFRRIAYRLVALQDQHGQWSGSGSLLLSTANESLAIGRVANAWHAALSRDPPTKIGVPDPVTYDVMASPGAWINHSAAWPDAAAFPTLASLVFLVESIDRPVSLDGIAVLPPPATDAATDAGSDKPPVRLSPAAAAASVPRPNVPRQELFDAIIAGRWPRKASEPPAGTAAGKPGEAAAQEPDGKQSAPPEKDDGLGKFEDFLEPAAK